MMQAINRYYEHSGKVEPVGFALMALFGLGSAVLLGFVYAYAIYYIPFIYLNFFITLFYGAAIGYSVGFGAKVGMARNSAVILVIGLICGLIGEYVQWSQSVSIISGGEILVASPAQLIEVLKFMASEGTWSIFGWTPKGAVLYLIWLIECVMIVGIATLMGATVISGKVFCEKCRKWLEISRVLGPYRMVSDIEGMAVQLDNGNFDSLGYLEPAAATDSAYMQIELTMCTGCQLLYLLTVNAILLSFDDEGEETQEVTTVVENLIVDRSTYGVLRKLGQASPVQEAP